MCLKINVKIFIFVSFIECLIYMQLAIVYLFYLTFLTLYVPIVSNVNFLLTISIQCQEIRLWELIKWSPKEKCLDLLSDSLNSFMKEMYRDQFGEFVRWY